MNQLASPLPVSPGLLADILRPYRNNAQYLKSAQIVHHAEHDEDPAETALIKCHGIFEIDESCYIDDTGHFNAVEFNICFNQLAYVLFGQCIERGIFQRVARNHPRLAALCFSEYKRQQLSSMLIVKLESSFLKMIKGKTFRGELTVNRLSSKPKADFVYTSIEFFDEEGIKAQGSVVLAFSPTPTTVAA